MFVIRFSREFWRPLRPNEHETGFAGARRLKGRPLVSKRSQAEASSPALKVGKRQAFS